jgi:peptidoglycan hydrolase-like protein with peptidoglycan-binding domain
LFKRAALALGVAALVSGLSVGGATAAPASVPQTAGDVSAAHHCKPVLSYPTLRWGSTGPAVSYAQCILRDHGGQDIDVDGVFGPDTHNAVLNLQRFFGLTEDGIIGKDTWAVLRFLNS